ncbi:MAG: pyridoxal-phosphate-dependent aminotransferase family protein [Helicobacteraceae bacterium]
MLLLTPGPTPVLEQIRLQMAQETIHHRTEEFEAIFGRARDKTRLVLGGLEPLFLASSGTGAMEACVAGLCKKKALVISSGKFGDRFAEIVSSLGLGLGVIKNDWDTPASLEQVKAELEKGDYDACFMQICESAGGLRHSYEAIAAYVKSFNPEISMVLDGITAVGVEKLDVSNVDALITGSQKAFMLPPGLAVIGLSAAATAKIEQDPRGYYFNLARELKNQRKNTTAYTPATTLIIGLDAMLDLIFETGLDEFYALTSKRHKAMLAAVTALGLKIYPKQSAPSMACIALDQAAEVKKILKTDFGISVAGGQDHLKGKIVRINNMGQVSPHEILAALNAIELALHRLGARSYDGTAARTFSQEYYL